MFEKATEIATAVIVVAVVVFFCGHCFLFCSCCNRLLLLMLMQLIREIQQTVMINLKRIIS